MLRLEFDGADKTVKAILDTISHVKDGAVKAAVAAINKTLGDVRKDAVRLAQSTYTAKAEDLRRKARITRAKGMSLLGKLAITDNRGMNLINFKAQPGTPGVRPPEGASVQVLRKGGRKAPRKHGQKAFIAKGRSGNTLMFVRAKQGPGGLEALYGPHPIQAFGREDARPVLEQKAEAALVRNLQNAVDAVLAASVKGRK